MATCSITGLEALLHKAGLDTPVPVFPGADIVHNPQDIFRAYLADTLQRLIDCDRSVAYDAIQPSNVTGAGDLVVVSPRLRVKDVAPKDLAADLALKFPRSPPFSCPFVDGIHLRVLSSPNTLPRLLLPYINDRKASYGYDETIGLADQLNPEGGQRKIVIEFSSPNMASNFTLSHWRSTLVGAFVANLFDRFGWNVVRMNYLGDWGKQIGLLVAGWQRFASEDDFQASPARHLLHVFSQVQEAFKPEQESLKAAKGETKETAQIESHGIAAERDDFFKKMEDREPEALALWQRFRDATVTNYINSYARLGIKFDEYSGESQVTQASLDEVESVLKEKGAYEESEGFWIIDFSKHDAKRLATAKLRYRNGTTTYLLRDIAAVLDRYKAHAFDRMIYVAGAEQEMHFQRIIKALQLMDRKDLADKIQHVSFARITGLGPSFADCALLDDYLERCQSSVQEYMAGENPEDVFFKQDQDTLGSIGLSALQVHDLNHKRTTGYSGDVKTMMNLQGETGTAFQNCYVRLLSVLSEHPDDIDYASLDYSELETEDYTELLRIMAQYPDVAAASYKTMEPAGIVGYVFRLVDQLMITLDDEQDHDCEGRETLVRARMALFENARQVLENALKLLGVTPVNL
ncbi:hypothetical protein B0I35DRAFT_405695 [Stachybotrys elegans]|uniref:arginine--tRNA ligase n=1 Tax=Stachybotrys elegans TaxID=80388 RepID=A0A8K0T5E8_9HYPO|nr:hypothetical protein B0I35DRAFT_405695 [Stachybotrys elegans]